MGTWALPCLPAPDWVKGPRWGCVGVHHQGGRAPSPSRMSPGWIHGRRGTWDITHSSHLLPLMHWTRVWLLGWASDPSLSALTPTVALGHSAPLSLSFPIRKTKPHILLAG